MPIRDTKIGLMVKGQLTELNDGGAEVAALVDYLTLIELGDGTGDNQINESFVDRRTLPSGTSEELDLLGGFANPMGNTSRSLVKVRALLIHSLPTNTTNLTIGNATNPVQLGFQTATQRWIIPPNGIFFAGNPVAGWAPVAGTGDQLKVENAAGASANYVIVALGVMV